MFRSVDESSAKVLGHKRILRAGPAATLGDQSEERWASPLGSVAVSKTSVLSFEELLGEIQGLLGEHVAVTVGAWEMEFPPVSVVATPDGLEEVAEGAAQWLFHPVVEVGGRLRRGDPDEADPGAVIFVVGEERPGRFARIHLSPSWVVWAQWLHVEQLPDGRQLAMGTKTAHSVLIQRVAFDGD